MSAPSFLDSVLELPLEFVGEVWSAHPAPLRLRARPCVVVPKLPKIATMVDGYQTIVPAAAIRESAGYWNRQFEILTSFGRSPAPFDCVLCNATWREDEQSLIVDVEQPGSIGDWLEITDSFLLYCRADAPIEATSQPEMFHGTKYRWTARSLAPSSLVAKAEDGS